MIYFKTNRTSRTGKKLSQVALKMEFCQDAQNRLGHVLGFSKFRGLPGIAYGGISSVFFEKTPNLKLWGKCKDGYMPKRKGKLGKQIYKAFLNLPTVSYAELNEAIKFENDSVSIGLSFKNKKLFLFNFKKEWAYNPPKDCKTITKEEYENLQK